MWAKAVLAVFVVLGASGCTPDDHGPKSGTRTPAQEQSPTFKASSGPGCSQDIPFEPTYLPAGFTSGAVDGVFPGERSPEDQAPIGEDQVIVHYQGPDSRAIEIRRPGTIFTELAQGDDAPAIEVLGTKITTFAPIEAGGNDYIVAFQFPPGAKPHETCSWFSLNGYGISLSKLTHVAESLKPTEPRTEPRPGEVVFYRLHPDLDRVDKACGAHDRSYVVRHVARAKETPAPLTSALQALFSRYFTGMRSRVDDVSIVGSRAIIDLRSMKGLGFASTSCGSVSFLGPLLRTVFQFDVVNSAEVRLAGSCRAFGVYMQAERCLTFLRKNY